MFPRMTRCFLFCALILVAWPLSAQIFDSGSTGVDGALVLDTPGEILFDPSSFTPALDADGDGIYQFTTITIGAGTTVVFKPTILGNRPIVWKASGDVIIDGILNLNGARGHDQIGAGPASPAEPGPGGFWGGVGSTNVHGLTAGQGPGGGSAGTDLLTPLRGGGAGHFEKGIRGDFSGGEGDEYGNIFLLPLVGGSGGSGGGTLNISGVLGTGGGAGGGAILIATSGHLALNGNVEARGGQGGQNGNVNRFGGGGSGGAIRLVAQSLSGTGTLLVNGGSASSSGNAGSKGRVRIEAFDQGFSGTVDVHARFATPGTPIESANQPTVRVVRVDGVAVPAVPTGSFAPADLSIDAGGDVTFEIEASYVPLGTLVNVMMLSEDGAESVSVDSTPLAGTLEASTATASLTIPPGFSRFAVQASWAP